MRRDRLTFAMMLGIPLLQLTLFGYAINSDPRHLPAAVLLADHGPQGRTLLHAMQNSTYFDFTQQVQSEAEGRELLAQGQVQFVVNIPENFTRDLLRGDRPSILIGPTPPTHRHRHRARRSLRCSTPLCATTSKARSIFSTPRLARSTSASTRSTTPRPSRNTTSSPASWA